MLLWHLDARGFGKEFDCSINELIDASMFIYNSVRCCLELSSYSWNMRDAVRLIYGLLLSVPETIEDVPAMKRLWVHEVLRVFSDRLTRHDHIDVITRLVESSCEDYFSFSIRGLLAKNQMADIMDLDNMDAHSIFFCDFSDPKADVRTYNEICDLEHLHSVVNSYVREYNNINKRPMPYYIVIQYFVRIMSIVSHLFTLLFHQLIRLRNVGDDFCNSLS